MRAGAPIEAHKTQADTYRQYAAQYNYGAWQLEACAASRKLEGERGGDDAGESGVASGHIDKMQSVLENIDDVTGAAVQFAPPDEKTLKKLQRLSALESAAGAGSDDAVDATLHGGGGGCSRARSTKGRAR